MKPKDKAFSGPINGENFTSDTRNQPWHRPPENTDVDAAIDVAIQKVMEGKSNDDLMVMLDNGATVAMVTDMLVTSGVGAGKWSPDVAILMAGPIARAIEIAAKADGIDYNMGIEAPKKPTGAYFRAIAGKPTNPIETPPAALEPTVEALPDEQLPQTGMLGV